MSLKRTTPIKSSVGYFFLNYVNMSYNGKMWYFSLEADGQNAKSVGIRSRDTTNSTTNINKGSIHVGASNGMICRVLCFD